MKRRITENLEVDLDRLEWLCHWCGHSLGSARENYKHGCVVAERSPHEIWRPLVDEKHSFSYDPGWTRLVEFYCPGCAAMIEVEMLAAGPPDHPRHRARPRGAAQSCPGRGRRGGRGGEGVETVSGPTGATIDVDIGGTFTDCFVRLPDGRMAACKTPTTGFRLAVGFMRALKSAATELGISTEDLLSATETIRYSTTVAMNTLIQRTGPRLALLATEGFQDVLRISRGASWMDAAVLREIRNVARITKAEPLVESEMTLAVRERVDCFGKVVRPLDEEHFLDGLRTLVDRGARGFVVSLLFSYVNPVHERRIRELIEAEFPEAYLGAMPIMLSSDVVPKRLEYTRTNTTVLNAYLHQSMWEELSGMGDELRDAGYSRGIMMVHNTGGMAEVYRTSAVQTYNGGPVAGLIGGSAIGKRLGYDNVLVTDMGGTSFDIGLVVKGSTRFYQFRPIIDRYWVDMSILETRSIGAGGGSIAWLNQALGNRLEVGPRGAGSMPGPACYGLGGQRADRDRCRPRARLHEPEPLLRRQDALEARARRQGDRDEDRQAARHHGRAGGAAHQANRRRQHGRRDRARDVPARLRSQGLRAVRLRRRRPDPLRRLRRRARHEDDGDLPVLAGLLRVGRVDHAARPHLRSLEAARAAGAEHPVADDAFRRIQRGRRAARAESAEGPRRRRLRCRAAPASASSSTPSTAGRSTFTARPRRRLASPRSRT